MDRDRGGSAHLERVEPPDRPARLRRHHLSGDDADRRGALRRVRDFGERGARSRSQRAYRRLRAGAPRRQGGGADGDGMARARRTHDPPVNVYLHTFGCKANQYDTELVGQAFADQGAALVDDPAEADVAVVNSCTVTHEAEGKMRRFVRRLARSPRLPCAQPLETVVIGCAAALDDGRIPRLPSVRAVVPGAEPAAVLSAAGYAAPRVDRVLRRFQANARGWLKIQDGCDEHCTFCA